MISALQPLSVGNAVNIQLAPPEGAIWTRVLRNSTGTFAGANDPNATLVADQVTEPAVLDALNLTNGAVYWYCDFATSDGQNWTSGTPASCTPAATYVGDDCDPQTILYTRISLGLAVEVAAGRLTPKNGQFSVIKASFGTSDTVFPCVSVHLQDFSPGVRFIGDELAPPVLAPGGSWNTSTGFLANYSLNIILTCQNGDERIAWRRALVRILQANEPVFEAAGLTQITYSFRDEEQFVDPAPLYTSAGSFTCTAPSYVQTTLAPITSVTTNATKTAPEF